VKEEHLITVGKITSVYGIKGWVKVFSYTDPKENVFEYQPWYLAAPEGMESGTLEPLEIDQHRPQGQGLVAHIKGVDDRDQARLFCQRDILISRGLIPDLPEGEYYWHQLEDLEVFSCSSGSLQLLGRVNRMMETGANDVMQVKPCDGSIDSRERLVPFVVGEYETQVSLDKGTITLDWDPEF